MLLSPDQSVAKAGRVSGFPGWNCLRIIVSVEPNRNEELRLYRLPISTLQAKIRTPGHGSVLDPRFCGVRLFNSTGRDTGYAVGDPRDGCLNILQIGISPTKDARFCVDVSGNWSNPMVPDYSGCFR